MGPEDVARTRRRLLAKYILTFNKDLQKINKEEQKITNEEQKMDHGPEQAGYAWGNEESFQAYIKHIKATYKGSYNPKTKTHILVNKKNGAHYDRIQYINDDRNKVVARVVQELKWEEQFEEEQREKGKQHVKLHTNNVRSN